MKPVLTILRDLSRADAYACMVSSAGVKVVHAQGAFHALTQLEGTEFSAIICEAEMGDMSGEEFRNVVHAEPKTSTLPVFILPAFQALTGEPDLSAPAPSGPEVLRQALQTGGVAPQALPVPMNSSLPAQLQGDLDQFQLPDLLGWVAELQFDGHWLIRAEDSAGAKRSAHLVMSSGHLIYAEYSGLVGRPALFALLQASAQYTNTTFQFYKTDQISVLRSSTLQQPTSRLLIELAVDIDHSRTKDYPSSAHQAN